MKKLFISIPVEIMTTANAAAEANFDDSINIFRPNASATGELPATHCVCAVNTTEEGELKINQLVSAIGGKVTSFEESPESAWLIHGLKPFQAKPN